MHTPGPWRALGFAINVDRHGLDGLTALGRAYACKTGPLKVSPIERDANARVMAAAPELLEALKLLLPEGWDDEAMDHMTGVRAARLAIAKAEGR